MSRFLETDNHYEGKQFPQFKKFEHLGLVQFLDDDGKLLEEYEDAIVTSEDELGVLIDHLPSKHYKEKDSDSTFFIFHMKKKHAHYTVGTKKVLTCGFDSANTYMRTNLSKGLDSDDLKWYEKHKLTNGSGLPQAYTFTVVNDLVNPHGIGISNIYIRKNSTLFDDTRDWIEALGCNPIAMVSRDCTNAEYLEKCSGGNPEVMDIMKPDLDNYKVEFTDQLAPGYYLIYNENHASYVGPRGNTESFVYAAKLDYLSNINYQKAPPTFGDLMYDVKSFNLWLSKDKEGNVLRGFRFKNSIAAPAVEKSKETTSASEYAHMMY